MPPRKPSSKTRPRKLAARAGSTPGSPQFGQPSPSPDPTGFKVPVSDEGDYSKVNATLLQPVPSPAGKAAEPILELEKIFGSAGAATIATLEQAGQIVFHAVGDTGSVKGPSSQSLVADKMVSDFTEDDPADVPSFFFHIGDVVYNFGEAQYYYDQFYDPYRDYPAPIIAIPGNHDGEIYTGDPRP
ncbi:MAG TPA: metallophosphoesterase, partial [Acidobacteriaceae bacterium]|nr:metallophosphoesterase [Acidobacteriaceae bacterium]